MKNMSTWEQVKELEQRVVDLESRILELREQNGQLVEGNDGLRKQIVNLQDYIDCNNKKTKGPLIESIYVDFTNGLRVRARLDPWSYSG